MRKLDPKKHPKLIAFLEKTQKVLKTVAVICFSLVIVLCVFFYTKACSEKNAAQLIKASAEEASTVADVESGLDLTEYPSANLYRYSVAREYLYPIGGAKVYAFGAFGFECRGKTGNGSYNNVYANGWFQPGANHGVLPVLPAVSAGQQVNVSFDLTLYETVSGYSSFSLVSLLYFDDTNTGIDGKSNETLTCCPAETAGRTGNTP